ncbi:MAG: hypothetical protein G01um101416_330 [Microgenomates group bacterium Gr01-1014_16]|nr:MAG: hypothetical protein G01um101416_330 [Microgenomates group bacterium Gr01-1014_16]
MVFPYIDKEPIVSLEIKSSQNHWLRFQAYVDSGASISVFKPYVAKLLGLNIYDGIINYLVIGDGSKIKIYTHPVSVNFAGVEFKARIGFSADLGTGVNLIGQRSFFDNFTFCFQSWRHRLEVFPK